jgi:hypothetical protein
MLRTVALGILVVAASATSAAADWRYCYAADRSHHRFYVSAPFPAAQPLEVIEHAFGRMLAERRVAQEGFACPRGGDQSDIRALMGEAVSYNRDIGNTVIPLDWTMESATASW